MDYSVLFDQTLSGLGFDLVAVYNCFDQGYDPQQGWPLKLPDVEFSPRTLLLLHFQDFVTPGTTILELQRVDQQYGDRAGQVLVTHWSQGLADHYQGAVNLIHFSNHNLVTVESLQAREQEWLPAFSRQKDLAWQCLNGRMCQHRRRVIDCLQHLDNGVISYGPEIPLQHWPYATYRGTENDENFIRLQDLYSRARINIVTETQYDARPGIITEKTLHAMIAGQIPLIIGHPGAVQDAEDLGFDLLRDVVDTSYDRLPNAERVEQAITLNRHLLQGDFDWQSLSARLQANRHHALHILPGQIIAHFVAQAQRLADRLLPR